MVFLIHAPDKNWRAFVQDQAGTHQGCEAASKSLVFSLILGSAWCRWCSVRVALIDYVLARVRFYYPSTTIFVLIFGIPSHSHAWVCLCSLAHMSFSSAYLPYVCYIYYECSHLEEIFSGSCRVSLLFFFLSLNLQSLVFIRLYSFFKSFFSVSLFNHFNFCHLSLVILIRSLFFFLQSPLPFFWQFFLQSLSFFFTHF
jgi:hypothetical protein